MINVINNHTPAHCYDNLDVFVFAVENGTLYISIIAGIYDIKFKFNVYLYHTC